MSPVSSPQRPGAGNTERRIVHLLIWKFDGTELFICGLLCVVAGAIVEALVRLAVRTKQHAVRGAPPLPRNSVNHTANTDLPHPAEEANAN